MRTKRTGVDKTHIVAEGTTHQGVMDARLARIADSKKHVSFYRRPHWKTLFDATQIAEANTAAPTRPSDEPMTAQEIRMACRKAIYDAAVARAIQGKALAPEKKVPDAIKSLRMHAAKLIT